MPFLCPRHFGMRSAAQASGLKKKSRTHEEAEQQLRPVNHHMELSARGAPLSTRVYVPENETKQRRSERTLHDVIILLINSRLVQNANNCYTVPQIRQLH